MNLYQGLEGKRVKIICTDGEVFEGLVSDYIYPDDNVPEGVAAVDIEDCPQRPDQHIGFNEYEIQEITVIE